VATLGAYHWDTCGPDCRVVVVSPIVDGKNVLEKDGFFRNERGLKDMTILLAFLTMVAGLSLVTCGMIAFWLLIEGWTTLIQAGVGIVLASGGLQAWEAKIESNNMGRQ
jgi:hypothetical protein